ncbi:hypothetical protein WCE41_12885 [Luteimonas sp. MJ246]|uniref:hypothetical protein n=1 Tax=Luteimonas sp. MJ174 TaxID=3129237 RepID=UPI0031BABEF3
MNARTILAMLAVATVLLAFVGHAEPRQSGFSVQEVLKEGERVEARRATITTPANGRATADRVVSVTGDQDASDSPDAQRSPYVFEMYGNVELKIDGISAYADAARYYPELDTFVAEHVRFPAEISSIATIGCAGSGNQVQVVYPNGTTVTADSVCAGGAMYTCSNHQLNKSVGAC